MVCPLAWMTNDYTNEEYMISREFPYLLVINWPVFVIFGIKRCEMLCRYINLFHKKYVHHSLSGQWNHIYVCVNLNISFLFFFFATTLPLMCTNIRCPRSSSSLDDEKSNETYNLLSLFPSNFFCHYYSLNHWLFTESPTTTRPGDSRIVH